FYFVLSTHTATSESLSLSLHDALPIFLLRAYASGHAPGRVCAAFRAAAPRLFQSWRGPRQARSFSTLLPAAWVREYLLQAEAGTDRKSTRLNSSHLGISYAVFCLKKKI